MITYSLSDLYNSTERYKLFTILCNENSLSDFVSSMMAKNINVINIGKSLSEYIMGLEDYSYLNIDVYDYMLKLLNSQTIGANIWGNKIVAIYNLGILFEPALEINVTQLLKDFSKSSALIIIWENQSEIPNRLHWSTQQNNIFLDFTETLLKELKYAL